ncbi:hypothetical protein KAH94_01575 [bacterium]|nr:hypothetical protein [bacterium]
MISEHIQLMKFDEKVSKMIRDYEKMQKREQNLINLKVKREILVKIK